MTEEKIIEAKDLELSDSEEELVEDNLRILEWNGEIVDFSDTMLEGALDYATEVIGHRAIPDVRDGLIPVQRRIVFAMDDKGNHANKPFSKSAETVGLVIGQYHPHGDQAAYESMVRLAQPWAMTMPLVEGQGNWGNLDGKPAAAARYTEARLSKIATDCVADMRKEIVRYLPNFTEKRKEASVIPMVFPALLINGASGIAWGMACSIPPHNLAEAIDTCVYLLDNPEATVKQLMKKMPGPDFPGGGTIVNPEALQEAYKTGRGRVKLRAKYSIEPRPGNAQSIMVTEFPYGVGPTQIIEKIEEAVVQKGVITDITENPVNLSDKNGPKLEIKVKRGGNVHKLLADLMKHASLEVTVGINMTVLVNRYPRVVNLKEALEHFLDFRLEVVRKRLEHEFNIKESDLRRQLAVRSALDVIRAVIDILEKSKDDEASKRSLIKILKYIPYGKKRAVAITDEQAQWIIEMQLRRITRLQRFDLDAKIKTLTTRLDEIRAILDSKNGVSEMVKEELREVKKKYGQARKTALSGAASVDSTSQEDLLNGAGPAEDITVYLSAFGSGLATPRHKLPATSPLRVGNASLVSIIETRSDQALYAFTERGLCYRVALSDLTVETTRGKGRSLLILNNNDAIVSACVLGSSSHYLFVTAKGQIKRIEEKTIQGAHAGGICSYKLSDDDKIVAVIGHEEGDDILIHTMQGQALRIKASVQTKLRPIQTGAAGGVAGIALRDDDLVVGATKVSNDALFIVHKAGNAKRVPFGEYPIKGRAGGGVSSADPTKPTRLPAGNVIWVGAVPAKGEVVLFTRRGQLIHVDMQKFSQSKRAAVPKQTLKFAQDDQIIGIIV